MGLLDALSDPQFRSDVGRGLLDAGNRGPFAGLLGGPVDLATMAMRPFGYGTEMPVGGSEWIGQKMQDAGLVTGNRNTIAELLAGLVPVGCVASKLIASMPQSSTNNASKSAKIYDPKPTQQRPFHDDYPKGIEGPDGSRLALDSDGRPVAPTAIIAGRRTVGGLDEGFSRVDTDRIASEMGISRSLFPRTGPELGGDAGRYVRNGDDRRVYVDNSLPDDQAGRVFSHEIGHRIDDSVFGLIGPKGSRIPADGLSKELRQIYSDLNSSMYVRKGKIGASPESQGYAADKTDAELMAEAIRAYMRDPNYIKTIAPQTAARIRSFVNDNPNLNKIVHFNSIGGAGLLGFGADYNPDR